MRAGGAQQPVTGQHSPRSRGRFGPRQWLLAGVLLLLVSISSLTSVDRYAEGEYEPLIQLSVVFVLQTGILPIAFLWIFLQLIKPLFRKNN